MSHLRIRSLAKINLDLRVLGKRPDGFHELRTIFQTVSLSDTIEIDFTRARSTRIAIDSDIPDNIILKAADAVLAEMGTRARVKFSLEKRIPLGGGLGGGSSNAAAVLMALPALARKRVPLERLIELASQLGSDVPFFLLGGTAVGLGRGTELYPLPDTPARPAILVCPGVHVSTAEAYRALERTGLTDVPKDFQTLAWQLGEDSQTGNDFEAVVFRQHPQLKSIKQKLLRLGARPALMSGSGSTIFGVFASRPQRDRAAEKLREDWDKDQVHPVSLVNRRKYLSLWRRQLQHAPLGLGRRSITGGFL